MAISATRLRQTRCATYFFVKANTNACVVLQDDSGGDTDRNFVGTEAGRENDSVCRHNGGTH